MRRNHEISINSFGIGTHHPPGFMRNRKGCGDFLFLHFLTPYRIHVEERVHFREAGECIIFSPTAHQMYGSDGMAAFGNDWMHFSGAGVPAFLEYLEIPVNAVLRPASTAFVPKLLKAISQEIADHRANWEFGAELHAKTLLFELSRSINDVEFKRLAPRNEELHEKLNRLRLEMQARCTERWGIDRMVRQVHMSRSKFITLYRRLFSVSPINDLIGMRLNLAKQYLAATEMTVTEIAEMCGFGDVYYFCRQFRKKIGVPAGSFRKNGLEPNANEPDPDLVKLWKKGKSLKHRQRQYEKAESAAQAEPLQQASETRKAGRADKGEKAEKSEKVEKLGKAEKAGKTGEDWGRTEGGTGSEGEEGKDDEDGKEAANNEEREDGAKDPEGGKEVTTPPGSPAGAVTRRRNDNRRRLPSRHSAVPPGSSRFSVAGSPWSPAISGHPR